MANRYEDQPNTREEPLAEGVFDPEQIEGGIRRLIGDTPPGGDRLEVLRARLATIFRDIPPEAERKLKAIFAESRGLPPDEEGFVRAISPRIHAFVAENFSPSVLEDRVRAAFVELNGFTPLNEVFSYGVTGADAHVHLAPARTKPLFETIALVKDGFAELAKQLVADPRLRDIRTISATSWIVAARPGIMERLGFTIDGPIDKDVRAAQFAGDVRPISICHMDRERFLEVHG